MWRKEIEIEEWKEEIGQESTGTRRERKGTRRRRKSRRREKKNKGERQSKGEQEEELIGTYSGEGREGSQGENTKKGRERIGRHDTASPLLPLFLSFLLLTSTYSTCTTFFPFSSLPSSYTPLLPYLFFLLPNSTNPSFPLQHPPFTPLLPSLHHTLPSFLPANTLLPLPPYLPPQYTHLTDFLLR